MDNKPLMDLHARVLLELQSLDPSLEDSSSSSGSDGSYNFCLRSKALEETYPELFYLTFNCSMFERREDHVVLAQYFTIGHDYSAFPERVPGFVLQEPPGQAYVQGLGEVTREVRRPGWVERDVDAAKERGLLREDHIRQIAEKTFLAMFPQAQEEFLDYDGAVRQLIAYCDTFGFPFFPQSPQETILRGRMKEDSRLPVFSHLFHQGGHCQGKDASLYQGSMLVPAVREGALGSLDVTGGFLRFYAALGNALQERGLPRPLLRC